MQHKVVLVVEDERENREVFELALKELDGIDVVTAKDGVEALRLGEELKPDLVLLDLLLPGLSGFEVAKQLRLNAATKSIPIVAITARGDAQWDSLDVGCDAYIQKPFDISHLLSVVRTYLPGI